ncbi:MAG: epoxyqueuosine reductase QueH [Desulfamplus sp.]|nr:epoxyqueuosine reductase QueH [Desulfamplus sp.]MBF0259793.1 epoxyqueuosine reductase QueH [Desulfamplus sp.]
MKVLLHMCCGPCSIYPLKSLEKEKIEVTGFFYRHNIHPFSECIKRETTLMEYAENKGIKVIYQKSYELESFIQAVVFREKDRCRFCYYDRLNSAAKIARRGEFDAFSSTLLYSRFQNHDLINAIGESIGKEQGVPFLYKDFRSGWKEGIEESKRLKMYRQQYCGCIYSEKERFYRACR